MDKENEDRAAGDHPFNREFCTFLEYHLCAMFKFSSDTIIKYWWCDGIDDESKGKSKKQVNKTSSIVTKAWIGKDGNDEYTMILKLGNKALSRYARGLDLKVCVPPFNNMDWIRINVEGKIIELQLL